MAISKDPRVIGGPAGISMPIMSRDQRVRAASHGGGRPAVFYGDAPVFTAKTPQGQAAGAYTYTFVASGTPAPTFAVKSGALPTGVTLNPATGVISGTAVANTYDFVISAINSFGEADATCHVVIT